MSDCSYGKRFREGPNDSGLGIIHPAVHALVWIELSKTQIQGALLPVADLSGKVLRAYSANGPQNLVTV